MGLRCDGRAWFMMGWWSMVCTGMVRQGLYWDSGAGICWNCLAKFIQDDIEGFML